MTEDLRRTDGWKKIRW